MARPRNQDDTPTVFNPVPSETAEAPVIGATPSIPFPEPEKAIVDPSTEMIDVIIHRPHGVTDSHAFFGFNGTEGQYAYDKPVKMPRAMVEHLRKARNVEYRASDDGSPVASYGFANSIVDA